LGANRSNFRCQTSLPRWGRVSSSHLPNTVLSLPICFSTGYPLLAAFYDKAIFFGMAKTMTRTPIWFVWRRSSASSGITLG
jgi:hypothetical protein